MLAMKIKSMILKDIPRSVDFEINKALINYSVLVCRKRGNDPKTFASIGSGTFVIRNGMYGILTAHHCLHKCYPSVSIGTQGKDKLLLMVTRSGCVILNPNDAKEHPLAIPDTDEFGPDLTFIEIFSGPKLDLLKAKVSFWNLDQKQYNLAKKRSKPGILIVQAGFPKVDYHTTIIKHEIHHKFKFMVFTGILGGEDIFKKDAWDYINSKVYYRNSENIPETFKGVSGGGIWAVMPQRTNNDQWTIEIFCLVGVVFYQIEVSDNRKKLRGHFIKTIYETAWNKVANNSVDLMENE